MTNFRGLDSALYYRSVCVCGGGGGRGRYRLSSFKYHDFALYYRCVCVCVVVCVCAWVGGWVGGYRLSGGHPVLQVEGKGGYDGYGYCVCARA